MIRYAFILPAFLCLSLNLIAQEPLDSIDNIDAPAKTALLETGGFVRGVAWGGSEQFDYSSLFGELALKGSFGSQKAFLKADVRFREGLFLGERKTVVELKEAYAGLQSKYADFFLGNQIVTWGRTDGFNPTNNLNPNDYFFLTPDPDDQKLGNFMLRGKVRPFDAVELDLVAIPFFRPSVYRYDLFTLGEGVSFTEPQLPAVTFANGAFAARFNVELPAIGFSISYFNGYDPFYGFRMQSFNYTTAPEIVFIPDFYRKQSIGADFAVPAGVFIFRGEAAYNLTRDYEGLIHIPNPDLSYVAGVEFSFAGITAIAQYIGKYTIDFKPLVEPLLTNPIDPAALYQYAFQMTEYEAGLNNRKIMHQQEETNHAVFLSLRRSFAFDVFTMGLSGYYDLTSDEYMVRPELKWKASDAVTVSLGGNLMDGPAKSIFDHAGKVLGGGYLGLTVNF